jgi:hypothetical protein
VLHTILPVWLFHPLGECAGTHAEVVRCQSYNFWSGVSGSFLVSVPAWTLAVLLFLRHHNCMERGCWRLGRFVLEGGVRSCEKHHPTFDERKPSQRGRVHLLQTRHLARIRRLT